MDVDSPKIFTNDPDEDLHAALVRAALDERCEGFGSDAMGSHGTSSDVGSDMPDAEDDAVNGELRARRFC
ncbi:hypothetical protein [Caballeronia sp. S22]|uniref:hypothetical protein n=1 Tax=Caballeronia sp. S22 TaxID=3137182 RepID=UPI003530DC68